MFLIKLITFKCTISHNLIKTSTKLTGVFSMTKISVRSKFLYLFFLFHFALERHITCHISNIYLSHLFSYTYFTRGSKNNFRSRYFALINSERVIHLFLHLICDMLHKTCVTCHILKTYLEKCSSDELWFLKYIICDIAKWNKRKRYLYI